MDGASARAAYLKSPDFAAGEYIQYPPGRLHLSSNRAPAVLGMIIERVRGIGYVQFMQEQVLLPLGMTRTMLRESEAMADGDVAMTAVNTNDGWTNSALARPAGMSYTSVADMTRVAEFLLSGNETFLSSELRQDILNPVGETNMAGAETIHTTTGMGLVFNKHVPWPWVTHYQYDTWLLVATAWDRYSHYMLLVPELGFGLVVITNESSWDPATTFEAALTLLAGAPPGELDVTTEPVSDFGRYVGTYYERMGFNVFFEIAIGDAGLERPGMCALVPGYPLSFSCNNRAYTFFQNQDGVIEYVAYTALKRVHDIDGLCCPRCSGRLKFISVIMDQPGQRAQGVRPTARGARSVSSRRRARSGPCERTQQRGHGAQGCVRIESPSGLGGGLVRGAVPLRVAGAVV